MASGAPDWLRQVVVSVVVENVPVVPVPAKEAAAGGIGRYSGTAQTYQTVEEWTVATAKVGELKEIILISSDFAHTHFKVVIGTVTFCTDTIVKHSIPLVFGDLRLAEAINVTVSCKSTDGTSIIVDAVIVGKEIG
jgi:hypothetical protein